jgi:Zn-dependent protease
LPALPVGPLSISFHLGRIPVVIHPSFWIGALVLGRWGGPTSELVLWVAVVLIAVLVHELGHAVTYRIFGSQAGIQLLAFGGATHGEPAVSRWRSLIVSLAGPFAGFALGGAMWLLLGNAELTAHWALYLTGALRLVSFYWGAINLLPISPLDGGHALEHLVGPRHAHRLPAFSAIVSTLVAAFFAYQRNTLAVVLFALFAVQNFQAWSAQRRARQPGPQGPNDSPAERQRWVDQGWAALRGGDERSALQLGMRAVEVARDDRLAAHALDLVAWASLAAGQPAQALAVLERVPAPSRRAFSWAMALDAAGQPAEALSHARLALSAEPTDAVAALAARLLIETGDVAGASVLVTGRSWGNPGIARSMRAQVALAEGRFSEAAEGFREAFLSGGRPDDALGAARAWVRAGALDRARAWLEEATRAGFDAAPALAEDQELAPLARTAGS